MKFSQIQLDCIFEIETFLKSSDPVFLLKGYAGTGKTTILREIANRLSSENRKVVLMAPTGRASMILSKKTKRQACTIHKAIYDFSILQEADEHDDFDFYFGLMDNEDQVNCLYIVDECSMISNVFTEDEFFQFGSGYLLNDLMKYCLGDARKNHKILFIGDPAQLPPVKMSLSPIFTDEFLITNNVNHFELSEVYRQGNDSGVLRNSMMLRDCISGESNHFELDFKNNDCFEIIRTELNNRYKEIAKEGGLSNTIVLTHSNAQALAHNENVRCLRYSTDDVRLAIREKDTLLVVKNDYRGDIILFNGMFVKVIAVGDIVRSETIRFKKRGGESGVEHIDWRRIKVEVETIEGVFVTDRLIIDNLLYSKDRGLTEDQTLAIYVDFKNRMGSEGIRPKTQEYKDRIRSDIYFNALQAKFGYAITVHKSQGGEWKNVVVDMATYLNNRSKGFLRWLYTGITRSSEKLYIIDPSAYSPISSVDLTTLTKITKPIEMAYYYPKSSEPFSFLKHHEKKILSLCENAEIVLSFEDKQYQRLFHFQKGQLKASCQFWYGNHFFKNRNWVDQNEAFTAECNEILDCSIIPNDVPFEPKEDFRKFLYEYILEIVKELEIRITNIIEKPFQDKYFLLTDSGISEMTFYYTAKEYYTSVVARAENVENQQVKAFLSALAIELKSG